MSQASVRVALVGAGAMANQYHYPSLASLPNVELVGISDLIESKAQETAERFKISPDHVYTDYRRMISDLQPQAAYVLMPPQHLYEPVHHILQQGCHIFVEKPLGLTVGQARMLSYTASVYGCLTMVGFQRRFSPAITSLRKQVEKRGSIHFAEVEFLKNTTDLKRPAGFYEGAIDPLTSDGIHAVDLVRWLCGGDVEEVHAAGYRRGVPGPIPNAFSAHITFSSGAVGFVQYNQFTGRRIFRSEFHGPNCTAFVDADRESSFVADAGELTVTPSLDFARSGALSDQDLQPQHWLGFWHESKHFIDCVVTRTEPSCNFTDAVKSMELTERILLSARSN